jgi:hypothetical protein
VAARGFHVLILAALALVGILILFPVAVRREARLVGALVVVQRALVHASDLRYIDVAFSNVNSIVGVLVMAFALADRFLLR